MPDDDATALNIEFMAYLKPTWYEAFPRRPAMRSSAERSFGGQRANVDRR